MIDMRPAEPDPAGHVAIIILDPALPVKVQSEPKNKT